MKYDLMTEKNLIVPLEINKQTEPPAPIVGEEDTEKQ